MKVERKNHSFLLRGLLFVMAFAMTVLYFPVSELVAYVSNKLSAMAAVDPANCYFMTLDEGYETTVNKGSDYLIPRAYIGGDQTAVVGDVNTGSIKSSSVTVTYNGMEVEFTEETASNTFATGRKFTANNIGTYTITYEYTYTGSDSKQYTNSYSINVESEVAAATIGFKNNEKTFLPSIIDLSLLGAGKDVELPTPYVTDKDGKELDKEDVEFVTSLSEATKEDVVVVTVYGGVAGGKVENSDLKGTDGKLYIKRAILDGTGSYTSFGADDYTVRYSYYKKSQDKNDYNFVSSATKTTTVYASNNPHYKNNYALTLKLGSSWTRTGHQTGVESTLPVATGATSTNTNPANEAVDVYYSVQVKYSSTSATSGYVALTDKTKGYEDIFEGDILKDPTKFKPLANGYYSFIYTVKDVYGNTAYNNIGDYYFDNVEDKTAPTILIYDASVKADEIKDESWKLASRHAPNSVVVYAISAKDNVSSASESQLSRQILTGDEVKLTIDNYDEYNLIFNYGGNDADSDNAWRSMLTNNYLINKAVAKAEKAEADAFTGDADSTSDEKRLAWLQSNGYLIVVDNANALNMYNYFGTIVSKEVSSVTDFNSFKTFLTKTLTDATARKTLSDLGLAYVNSNETFGATTSQVTEIGGTKYYGMGARSYYIRYTATDKAGNKNTKTESMMISSGVDGDAPTIRFTTTLADKYVPNTTIKIDKPTASDTRDTNMNVVTLYRYLNKTSAGTTVLDVLSEDKVDDEENPVKISTVDLTDVFEDLATKEVKDDSDPVNLLVDKYAKFNGTGYVDLTVSESTSYSIDLKKAPSTANTLQVVSYVYDDYGNLNMYAKEVAIENIKDEHPVRFTDNLKITDANYFAYNQSDEITLPEITVVDDAVNYVTYDVNAYYVEGDTNISVYGTDKDLNNGIYILKSGKFVASSAGEYRVSVAFKDSQNRTIVAFMKYTVSGRTISQAPSLATSLESGSYQLDENPEINIPTPTISYNIAKSMTQDQYDYLKGLSDKSQAQQDALNEVNYVVVGVDENNAVKEGYGSVNVGTLGSVFKPKTTGNYDVVYTAEMTAYNVHMFEFNDKLTWNSSTNKYDYGRYYQLVNTGVDGNGTNKKSANIKVETLADGSYKVTSGSTVYNVSKDEDNKTVVTKNGANSTDSDFTTTIGISTETLYNELMSYRLKSEPYSISITDTTGPKFKENYYEELYAPKLSIEQLQAGANNGVYSLKIYGLEATDASGLDENSASIRVTGTLANGNSAPSATFEKQEAIKGGEYKINVGAGSKPDGTYTITYSVKDKKGNSATSKVVTIVIGDVTAPKLKFDDSFFDADKTYTVGEQLVLDPSLISVTNMDKNQCTTKIEVVADADGKNLAEERNGKYYVDDLQVGSYTIKVTVTRDDGPTTTETFKFDVTTESQSNTEVYQIVGIVLIVLSVLVLVGVIV
ncbi:MAG: hypothetical protein K2K31_01485, partial [Clostridia bacterium]|nr:hypothetical protein [Clostridia bacterium]